MIANVSPCSSNFEDTFNTLKYANRTKDLKTNVKKNVDDVKVHVTEYEKIIQSLRNEIVQLKSDLIKKDMSQIKKPIKMFYEDKKHEEHFEATKTIIYDHFKYEYNLINQIISLDIQIQTFERTLMSKKEEFFSMSMKTEEFERKIVQDQIQQTLLNEKFILKKK